MKRCHLSVHLFEKNWQHSLPGVNGVKLENFFSATEYEVSFRRNIHYQQNNVTFVTCYTWITLKLKILISYVRNHQEVQHICNRTSYSTPEMHCQPLLSATDTAFRRVPLGHTDIGSFVSGSRYETKKKGTLFSQGIRRYVDRSTFASRSL